MVLDHIGRKREQDPPLVIISITIVPARVLAVSHFPTEDLHNFDSFNDINMRFHLVAILSRTSTFSPNRAGIHQTVPSNAANAVAYQASF